MVNSFEKDHLSLNGWFICSGVLDELRKERKTVICNSNEESVPLG